jgi:cAMP phosphodiesterase
MKFQLLPSSFEEDGSPSARQHLACLVVDGRVAIDAGSLAMAATDDIRRELRDVVLTHAHLDHIAGLPLYVDDLFASLDKPITVHALDDVIEVLERDVFNWAVFPRFSELKTPIGPAIRYNHVEYGKRFEISSLNFQLFPADHKVPSAGVIVGDGKSTVAISGDTASLAGLQAAVANVGNLRSILVECAFPNELTEIARNSHHMTPAVLGHELSKLKRDCPVFVINIKPRYRDQVVTELAELKIDNLKVMSVGETYLW